MWCTGCLSISQNRSYRRCGGFPGVLRCWLPRLGGGVYELREVNGVACVLTEAAYAVSERNTHAGFLNYYVMKVSSGETRKYTKPLPEPVVLQNGAVEKDQSYGAHENGLGDLVLGTRRDVSITLIGTDEVGRAVRVRVAN